MSDFYTGKISRRAFLRAGLTAAVGLSLGRFAGSAWAAPNLVGREAEADDRLRKFLLTAMEGEVELGAGETFRTWLYDGRLPGPEIRVREGERLRVELDNRLPEATTVHWHGIPLPNAQDGVPGLTQAPIAPGERFRYEFRAAPGGSYLYHSHMNLQLDRGLYGPLIIEERTPHVDYDREFSLLLDDHLPAAPRPLEELVGEADAQRGEMMGGMMGGRMGRMMGGFVVPPYAALLANGRLPSDPPVFEVRRRERVRLRLLNPSGATTYRIAVAGHRMTVVHADGQPVEPVQVDSLTISMGERYDVLIETDNPGVWPIDAAPVEGDTAPARAVLRYQGVRNRAAPQDALAEGLREGRQLQLADLRALDPLPAGEPDRTLDLTLSGRGETTWMIDGETWPEAAPLRVERGQRVRCRMLNRSMMIHPMHLHGHFFRVADAMKDTVLVPPHMGRVEFDFIADNPGRWLFHCHNIYHMEAGMAREFRYVQ